MPASREGEPLGVPSPASETAESGVPGFDSCCDPPSSKPARPGGATNPGGLAGGAMPPVGFPPEGGFLCWEGSGGVRLLARLPSGGSAKAPDAARGPGEELGGGGGKGGGEELHACELCRMAHGPLVSRAGTGGDGVGSPWWRKMSPDREVVEGEMRDFEGHVEEGPVVGRCRRLQDLKVARLRHAHEARVRGRVPPRCSKYGAHARTRVAGRRGAPRGGEA